MVQGILGQDNLPVACALEALQAIFAHLLPVAEVADEVDGDSIGCPFAEHPAGIRLVESKVLVAIGKLRKGDFTVLSEGVHFAENKIVAAFDGFIIRLQPRVVLYNLEAARCALRSFLGCGHMPGVFSKRLTGKYVVNIVIRVEAISSYGLYAGLRLIAIRKVLIPRRRGRYGKRLCA